jgi:hypothetical protein
VELENGVDTVLTEHVCNSQQGNVRQANIKHREFLPLQQRISSLAPLNLQPADVRELARRNVFLSDNILKFYCCGAVVVALKADKARLDNIKDLVDSSYHSNDCDRY